MRDWLTSQDRRKYQRKMNKIVREMNKNIENDDLWFGRFMVHQVGHAEWYNYGDGSFDLFVCLEFVDRCTGTIYRKYDSVNSWCYWHGSLVWRTMNWFITEYCEVWKEELAQHRGEKLDPWRKYNREVRVV